MNAQYDIYQPPGGESPESGEVAQRAQAGGPWMIVVEFSNEGNVKPPTVIDILPDEFSSREDAHQAAEQVAIAYRPPDPFAPQARDVFADGPDGFLTIVQGAVSTFHFSTRVVQYRGSTAG